jgi:hypothetical protein
MALREIYRSTPNMMVKFRCMIQTRVLLLRSDLSMRSEIDATVAVQVTSSSNSGRISTPSMSWDGGNNQGMLNHAA